MVCPCGPNGGILAELSLPYKPRSYCHWPSPSQRSYSGRKAKPARWSAAPRAKVGWRIIHSTVTGTVLTWSLMTGRPGVAHGAERRGIGPPRRPAGQMVRAGRTLPAAGDNRLTGCGRFATALANRSCAPQHQAPTTVPPERMAIVTIIRAIHTPLAWGVFLPFTRILR